MKLALRKFAVKLPTVQWLARGLIALIWATLLLTSPSTFSAEVPRRDAHQKVNRDDLAKVLVDGEIRVIVGLKPTDSRGAITSSGPADQNDVRSNQDRLLARL